MLWRIRLYIRYNGRASPGLPTLLAAPAGSTPKRRPLSAPSGKGIIKAHSTFSNNFLHTLNINKQDSWDITKPKLVLDHSYTITYPTASLTEDYKIRINSDIIEASTHGICCFTHGSKTEPGTGGGFVISDTRTETITEHSFKMKDYCTVFQAETAAIKHAAEELITFNNQQITFWSDSLSALQALSNKIHNNKSINDCHKALTKLADENTVQLKWIKAHTGHWGNEKADELAKAGTVSSAATGIEDGVCCKHPLSHSLRVTGIEDGVCCKHPLFHSLRLTGIENGVCCKHPLSHSLRVTGIEDVVR